MHHSRGWTGTVQAGRIRSVGGIASHRVCSAILVVPLHDQRNDSRGSVVLINTSMISLVESLLEYHLLGPFDIIEWTLLGDAGWSVGETKTYRKGMGKYQADKRIMKALSDLIQFVTNQPKQPPLEQYPNELNVHPLRSYPNGTLWAHLKSQHVGVVFKPNYQTKELELLNLCTHDKI